MKKYVKLLPIALVGLMLAGCGTTGNQRSKPQSSRSHSSSQVADSSRQMNNSNSSALKRNPNVNRTSQKKQALNKSNSSDNGAKKTSYSNSKIAKDKVDYHNKNDVKGMKTVNLGSGIKGYEDRGAGQIYIVFYMGNWSMEVHGNDVNNSNGSAVSKAKQLVTYLQSHTLPIPRGKGNLAVDASDDSARITWQKQTRVNRLNGGLNQVLRKAVTMK